MRRKKKKKKKKKKKEKTTRFTSSRVIKGGLENKTSTPLSDIQHNISFEDGVTCDADLELLGFNGRTIITLYGSAVINFPLPVLPCHADAKSSLRKLHFHQYVVDFFQKQAVKSKRDELE
ncbi:hypothetical protein ABVT39_026662 [Epinephelus coioides]